jgi:hypothetical protein
LNCFDENLQVELTEPGTNVSPFFPHSQRSDPPIAATGPSALPTERYTSLPAVIRMGSDNPSPNRVQEGDLVSASGQAVESRNLHPINEDHFT